MRTILIITILLNSLSHGFTQRVKLNDSNYLHLEEELETRSYQLSLKTNYKMQVFFLGFEKDLIEVFHNGHNIFSDTVTTTNRDGEYISPLKGFRLRIRKKNNLSLAVNGFKMEVPLKKGYALLYIGSAPDKVMGENVTLYSFRFTNEYVRRL